MFQTDFLDGLGQLLENVGIGVYKTTGQYTPTDTAITVDQLPTDPDRAIGMTLYPVTDSGNTDSVLGIQFRVRGPRNDRRFVKDTTDLLFDQLHDLQRVTIGGTIVVRMWRQSGANLPPDGNNRQEATSNFYAQITRPGTHRKD